MAKDWSFYKAGDITEVFEPTAINWIQSGIAEAYVDKRSVPVERTVDPQHEDCEKAIRKPSARK